MVSSPALAARLVSVILTLCHVCRIGGTLSLISFIGFSSQLFIVLPAIDSTAQRLKLLIPFNLLLVMLYWNYFLTASTDPGAVPKGWVSHPLSAGKVCALVAIARALSPLVSSQTPAAMQDESAVEVKKQTGEPRHCRSCKGQSPSPSHARASHPARCETPKADSRPSLLSPSLAAYKPPRAHHCRKCKRCVLRMDHHCQSCRACRGTPLAAILLLMCPSHPAMCRPLG